VTDPVPTCGAAAAEGDDVDTPRRYGQYLKDYSNPEEYRKAYWATLNYYMATSRSGSRASKEAFEAFNV